jgi:hypothetical protein
MTAAEANQQRAEFLSDALYLFRRVARDQDVSVTVDGTPRWRNKREAERWAQMHAAADAVVKRYYASLQE